MALLDGVEAFGTCASNVLHLLLGLAAAAAASQVRGGAGEGESAVAPVVREERLELVVGRAVQNHL